MSYILDALKKAERDRRRARVPSIQTMHAAPPERRRAWPWIVGGALALNAVGFAALFVLRPALSPIPSIATSPPTSTPSAASARPPDAAGAMSHAGVDVDEPAAGARAPHAGRATDASAGTTESAAREPGRRAAARSSTKSDEESTARESSRVAPVRERARVDPDMLKLEVLIYSENAAERVAYINGQRYVEGQRVDGRIVVERIASDGVVLATGGKRYLLKQQ